MTASGAPIAATDLFEAVMHHGARADPYPLYAQMREHPVLPGPNGLVAITRHRDIHALLRDGRILSDPRKSAGGSAIWSENPDDPEIGKPPFIFLDPPDHTRLRALVVRQFQPRMVARLRPRIVELVDGMIDEAAEAGALELVEDLALPLPVAVICELLGVPHEDVPKFKDWSAAIARALDPGPTMTEDERMQGMVGVMEMLTFMNELVERRRDDPGEDLLSALTLMTTDGGDRLNEHELITSLVLLLVAGHETTVNLISNAMLALLRHPDVLARVRAEPALITPVIEETLRFDPPVHIRNRTCTVPIEVAGETIPAGANIALMLASANRDPEQFAEPDRFDIDRAKSAHFGFGGGIHFCLGASLARMEAEIALTTLLRRVEEPRLLADPPSYRPNAALRGPDRMDIGLSSVRSA